MRFGKAKLRISSLRAIGRARDLRALRGFGLGQVEPEGSSWRVVRIGLAAVDEFEACRNLADLVDLGRRQHILDK